MTSIFPFMYDESGILGNQKCFILTIQNNSVSLQFLTAVFNSFTWQNFGFGTIVLNCKVVHAKLAKYILSIFLHQRQTKNKPKHWQTLH